MQSERDVGGEVPNRTAGRATDPATRRTGREAATTAAVVLAHAIAATPWQAVARRIGLPFRTPRPATAIPRVAAVLALAASATTLARRLVRLVAAPTPGSATASAWAPGAVAAVAPFPVLGPYAAAGADLAVSVRLTRGTDPPAARVRRALVGAATLVVTREAVRRALCAWLAGGIAATPRTPAPDLSLNLVATGVGIGRRPAGYIVYFDGVGRATPRTTPVGRQFAEAIHRRLPTWTVVMSVMPNDVTQRPSWERPATGALWRYLMRRSRNWLVARGIWEAVVALDERYRDRLAVDQTATVLAHVLAAGYPPGSGTPLVLVGLSAGAQTALRSASDVARALGGAPVDVVVLGGFADGGADLSGVRRVHAAVSWGDPAELAPVPFLPSRWTALHVGNWSRARRSRHVVVHHHDYATHVGRTGYLGRALTADGRTRMDQSADLVQRAARELLADRGQHGRATRGAQAHP